MDSLVASIRHQAEKLGYLTAQVEKMFADRVKYERNEIMVRHALEAQRIHRLWLDGDISDDVSAQMSANAFANTSTSMDNLESVFKTNINQLNLIVQEHVAIGKASVNELDDFLNEVLDEDNNEL